MSQSGVGEVYLIQTSDKEMGVGSLLSQFDLNDYSGKKVALKANFNSAAELGIGAKSASEITLTPLNDASRDVLYRSYLQSYEVITSDGDMIYSFFSLAVQSDRFSRSSLMSFLVSSSFRLPFSSTF